jgi:5-formyltetrahydrofolate cyclo-ligase
MTDDVANDKALLRAQVLATRNTTLAADTASDFGELLIKLCKQLGAKTVGVYLSFGSEPATDSFVIRAKTAGIELAAPRTGPESSMEFGLLVGPTTSSPLGFLQPIGEIVDPKDLDLIIAPALSIAHSGARLGRGGGFFDRYLENYSGPVAALVFDGEFVDELPVEDHDLPVSFAVTQSAIYELPYQAVN